MKKNLIAVLLFTLALAARADLIWYEDFNYPNGSIITNAPGNWTRHSGTATPSDSFVNSKRLQISATGGTLSRQDDVNRKLTGASTNALTTIYASFTVNCTNLPSAAGGYFAHFQFGTTVFYGRLFALTGTNLCSPGTFRIGVSANGSAPNQIFPVDLAPNTDYQVVVHYDPTIQYSTLWINPISSSDTSVSTSDIVAGTQSIIQAYGFRQASLSGNSLFLSVSNLAVATTFDEAATNVWSTAPVAPVVVTQPVGLTNFVGNSASIFAVANGQSLATLNYQWKKGGVNVANPNGNSSVFSFPSLTLGDSGNYTVVVSNPATSLSVTSAVAIVSAVVSPFPPTLTKQPTNTTVYFGQTATLAVTATGTQPITYQWYYNNNPIGGATDATLVVPNVNTNNGTVGNYKVEATNPNGTTPSTNALLSVISAPSATIGFLRTLVDGTFFLPTNTTALYSVTGIVTTYTNLTTTGNSQFYMQDGTGGITVFVAGNGTILPQAGDSVTVTGPLGQFNSLLEMNLSSTDPAHMVVTNSSGNALPASVVLPFSFTNSVAYGGISNAIRLYQSALVTMTNVYFPAAFTNGTFASGVNYTMTNAAGETFPFRVDARVFDIIGKPIPTFAYTVTGPMAFFLGSTAPDRSAGYQILPTRFEDIVTNAPIAVTVTQTVAGANKVLTWPTEAGQSYSVLQSTTVTGPYSRVVTKTFVGGTGSYVVTNATTGTKFLQIVSP